MAQALLVVAYAASAVSVVSLGVAIVRRGRLTPAGVALLALIVSILAWTGMAVWGVVVQPENLAMLLAWTMPAAASVVASVRVLVWALSDASWRPSVRALVTMSGHPVATVLAASIPQLRELVVVDGADGLHYGPVFWVHVAVSYILLMSALLEMVHARARIPMLAPGRAAMLIFAWVAPFTINVIKILFIQPGGPDITPIGFVFTAAALYVAVVRGGFADLSPIARHQVFEHLVDAVFVVSTTGRLMDANAQGRVLGDIGDDARLTSGLQFTEVCPQIARAAESPGEHDIERRGEHLVLDIALTELTDSSGTVIGQAVRARDVTQVALQRRELARMHDVLAAEAATNEKLRAKLADQALRDQGTGLYNRRYIMDKLPQAVEQCERDGVPLSVAMIDLDHFKEVNDTWGHSVGDRVLAAAAHAMDDVAPEGTLARFGGEEFILLLPGVPVDEAKQWADALRAACAEVQVPTREGAITLTASAGVASAAPGSINASALIDAADAALYRAKAADRDRTWVASSD
ncbi:diguanylate cyclase [Demequina sp. TTPB684]|uniref:histidine kinase N-terminal 7TM domain-containing diguanylate cyclase n=1 Tax=unclassified Demequina TaxID=2620311 RepID=UPI001CF5C924|nr:MULTISPECIES: diguanylate cyclase [unclassified Demequina]MCB2413573.1 diguanylate cyclase [Demequina sp. TTPB684]UPU88574.1 diguanylate cyclase [Demequina sp. TMPB413]